MEHFKNYQNECEKTHEILENNGFFEIIEIVDNISEFDKFDKNQIPLYRVFNYTPKEGQDMQRTRSKWYNYSDELKQTEYNIKQLKTNTPDVLKNIENNAKKFNFIHGEEGKAYNIWNAADNYIQKKKKILKRVSDPEVIKSINEDINRKMQEAVNDLDKLN